MNKLINSNFLELVDERDGQACKNADIQKNEILSDDSLIIEDFLNVVNLPSSRKDHDEDLNYWEC